MDPIFSSIDYYKDPHFQRCLRNWNIYLDSEEPREQVLVEWEEVLLNDFLTHAREWLWNNKHWESEELV